MRKIIVLAIGSAALALFLTACGSKATSSAMCAVVVGDGSSGHDSRVHSVYFPDSHISYNDQSEKVQYFPCNSRNYYINPKGQKNAAGAAIGDRHTPTIAYTNDGTQVRVWSHALWTLNETSTVLKNRFWPVCLKYNCASDSGSSGDSNFSTKGWNGMLGEVFGPSQDRSVTAAINKVGDDIWQKPTQESWKQLGLEAANNFADNVQQEVGYTDARIFCGSGNSQWPDSSKPGKGSFTCSNVRIIIDGIEPVSKKLADQVQSTSLNKQRLTKAKELYGDLAPYFLGLQDTIDQCKNHATCVINIGGSGSIPVATNTGK